jgi:hypothetical protein
MNTKQLIRIMREYGFSDGRMISHSKTGYCKVHPDHCAVFNAQVFWRRGRILKQADLDLRRDAEQLTAAAKAAGENLYVLYEGQPSAFWLEHKVPIPQVLRHAVWWSQIRPEDKDRFASIDSARRPPKTAHVTCTAGAWEKRPAYRMYLGSKYHTVDGSILLLGRLPSYLHAKIDENFPTNGGPVTKGRPVRPVFYHQNRLCELVWFSHLAAVPALLFDCAVRPLMPVTFRIHQGSERIAIRKQSKVIGMIFPCLHVAPQVVSAACQHLADLKSTSHGLQDHNQDAI